MSWLVSFFPSNIFLKTYLCVYERVYVQVCLYVSICECGCRCPKKPEEGTGIPWRWNYKAFVNHLMRVLGTKFLSSARAANVLRLSPGLKHLIVLCVPSK